MGTELAPLGKTQNILSGGPDSHQAAGSAMGYKRLRRFHDAGDNTQFSRALAYTIPQGVHDKRWLAEPPCDTLLPTWPATMLPSPFRNPARVAAPPVT